MKASWHEDEWYPVHVLEFDEGAYGYEIEIPDELAERYKAVSKEFDLVQYQIANIVEAAMKARG